MGFKSKDGNLWYADDKDTTYTWINSTNWAVYGGAGNASFDGNNKSDTSLGGTGNDVSLGGTGGDISAVFLEDPFRCEFPAFPAYGVPVGAFYGGDGNATLQGDAGGDMSAMAKANELTLTNAVLQGGTGGDISAVFLEDPFVCKFPAYDDRVPVGGFRDPFYGGDGNAMLQGDAGGDISPMAKANNELMLTNAAIQGSAVGDISAVFIEDTFRCEFPAFPAYGVPVGGFRDPFYGGDGNATLQGDAGGDISAVFLEDPFVCEFPAFPAYDDRVPVAGFSFGVVL